MLYIKLLLIFISVHELFAACPAGSIQGNHPTNCYFVYASPKNWVAADEACQNGHLTSISDVFQNAFLQNVINSLFVNADGVWIGGNTLITPGNWTWSDNTPFIYTNWQKGQPTGNQGLCASINRVDGSWSSQNCLSLNLPYICKINGTLDSLSTCSTSASLTCPSCSPCTLTCPSCSPCTTTTPIYKPCPDDYTYNQETKFCYKAYNTSANFNDAEVTCNNDGGSLASIHSYSENSFIGTQFGISTTDDDYTWIGLQLQNGQWTWTDGTPTDYLNWAPGQPYGNYNCTGMYLGQLDAYYLYFNNYGCNNLHNFICKRSAL